MVYNITNNSPLYPAVYTWNGMEWVTSQINETETSSIGAQPKAFTFYETGEETVVPLTFVVNGKGTWTYQWYQVTGNNVHVRIGTPVGQAGTIYTTPATAEAKGSNTAAFTPQAALKGTTRNGNNNGFYKFYCVAESSLGAKFTSNIAEVAVGCGAKNKDGEWISFMCFNLGAQNGITIQEQKNYPVGVVTNGSNLLHTYKSGEENVWGSLFQWGRIADGHELRDPSVNNAAYTGMTASDIGTGNRCSPTGGVRNPESQVKPTSAWYGKFIYGMDGTYSYHWAPVSPTVLWATYAVAHNDPCAHYRTDGTYREFWYTGTDGAGTSNGSAACVGTGTAWHIPSQGEWGSIYREGNVSGAFSSATANTWVGYNGTSTNYSRGFEVKPDNETTTLFLPATGFRSRNDGLLYNPSVNGYYWTSSLINTNAYYIEINAVAIYLDQNMSYSMGMALRCIKNS
jgi:uncharacterized protein (TIGR02145 family)